MSDKKEEVVDRGDETDVKSAQDLADEAAKKEADDKAAADKAAAEKAAADDAAKKATDKENRIPQSRVDEITRKNREAIAKKDEEITNLKAAAERVKVNTDLEKVRTDIADLEDKYDSLLEDGKMKEAKEVRRQIRDLQDVYQRSLAVLSTESSTSRAIEQMRYDNALALLEQKHSVLNPDTDDFDTEVVEEIMDVLHGLQRNGVAKADALRRAVKYVIGEAKEKELSKEDKEKADALRKERVEGAVKKGLDANGKQPADTTKVGLDSDKGGAKDQKIDVMKLTQAQFAKLDEETLSSLRGDIV